MNITVIVQARFGSTRLPGKVMRQLGDRSVLSHVIDRCHAFDKVTQVVVATTNQPTDDMIQEESLKKGVFCYRGSEEDVLSRYYETAQLCKSDVIVRITSDCPLIDPWVSSQVINHYLSDPEIDYCSNVLKRCFPRGLDTEVFSLQALENAYRNAKEALEREHVTPYIIRNPQRFRLSAYVLPIDCSKYRWTLDTEEDWELIKLIYERLYRRGTFFPGRIHWI